MTAEPPLFSIVIPSYNQGCYIADTIESVLNQDYPRIECIVVDGGSQDNTLDVLRQYADRLHWISEPDHGQAEALNKGWRLAQGEILGWLNSDDVYCPGALRAVADAFATHPEAGAIYGDCDYISATGEFLEKYDSRPFDYFTFVRTSRSPNAQPSTFLRREVFDRVGPVDETLHLVLDWEYWLRVGAHYPIVYLPRTLAGYRVHARSKSSTEDLRFGVETISVYQRLFANPDLPPEWRRLKQDSMNNVYLWAAKYAFDGGHLSEARRYLILGWKYRPLRIHRFMPKVFFVSFLGRHGWSAWMWLRRRRGAKLSVFEKVS